MNHPNVGSVVKHPRLAKNTAVMGSNQWGCIQRGMGGSRFGGYSSTAGWDSPLEDMKNVQPVERTLLTGSYRGWTIQTMPAPSSGGIVILQVLKVLEGFDITRLGHNSSELLHLYAEAFQHAFADRANYMGDPDRIDIPMEQLLSDERIQAITESFTPEQTHDRAFYGTLVDIGPDAGTQHISVVDKDGMAVSLTHHQHRVWIASRW